MEIGLIANILKKRIKEKGYTQQSFADACEYPFESLKPYWNGKRLYNIEKLEKFAEKLDCTYDYLLGKSTVANPKYKTTEEETGLSPKAIDKIKQIKNSNEIEIINRLFETEKFIDRVLFYFEEDRIEKQIYNDFIQAYKEQSNLTERDKAGIDLIDVDSLTRLQIAIDLTQMKQEYLDSIKR